MHHFTYTNIINAIAVGFIYKFCTTAKKEKRTGNEGSRYTSTQTS